MKDYPRGTATVFEYKGDKGLIEKGAWVSLGDHYVLIHKSIRREFKGQKITKYGIQAFPAEFVEGFNEWRKEKVL